MATYQEQRQLLAAMAWTEAMAEAAAAAAVELWHTKAGALLRDVVVDDDDASSRRPEAQKSHPEE